MSDARTRRDLLVDGIRLGVVGCAGAALSAPAPALAASTTTTAAATAGATTGASSTAQPDSEPLRVHRMLSVELLLLFCYQAVLSTSILPPRSARALRPLRAHEEAHIRVLSARLAALGGNLPSPPTSIEDANRDLARRHVIGRLGQLRGAPDALGLLFAVERVTVGVYFVALTKLRDPNLVRLAAEIMANDAQHEAILGELLYHGNVQQAVPYGLIQGVQ